MIRARAKRTLRDMSLVSTCLCIGLGLTIAWAILKDFAFFDQLNR